MHWPRCARCLPRNKCCVREPNAPETPCERQLTTRRPSSPEPRLTDISRDLAGPRLAALNAASREALRVFAAAGFDVIEPGQLLDAENLLDLYGEDVRARTFVFPGADRELCLRPDLTLPICRHHLTGAAQGQARYAAAGSVFRKPNSATGRAAEFRQVGAEWYGAHDPAGPKS